MDAISPAGRWALCGSVVAVAAVVAVMAAVHRPAAGTAPPGVRASVPLGGDFIAFWAGGSILATEGDAHGIYHRPRANAELGVLFPEAPPRYRLAYPPPVYQLCAVLQPLSYRGAAGLFVVGMALLYGVGGFLLLAAFPALRERRLVFWALIWVSPAAIMMTLTGQLSGLWFALLAGAALAWQRDRAVVAGLLLGLLCVKPTLAAPVALGLLIAGQGTTLAGFVLGGALALGISMAADGPGPWLRYLEMLRDTPDLTQRMWLHPERQFTLRTLLALPFRDGDLAGPLGWAGVTIGLALCAIVAPWTWRAARRPTTAMFARGVALSAGLLAAPHLFDYDLGMHGIGLAASVALLARGEVSRPLVGRVLVSAAFLAPLAYPAARWARASLGTVLVAAWVLWMAMELRALTRRR